MPFVPAPTGDRRPRIYTVDPEQCCKAHGLSQREAEAMYLFTPCDSGPVILDNDRGMVYAGEFRHR